MQASNRRSVDIRSTENFADFLSYSASEPSKPNEFPSTTRMGPESLFIFLVVIDYRVAEQYVCPCSICACTLSFPVVSQPYKFPGPLGCPPVSPALCSPTVSEKVTCTCVVQSLDTFTYFQLLVEPPAGESSWALLTEPATSSRVKLDPA